MALRGTCPASCAGGDRRQGLAGEYRHHRAGLSLLLGRSGRARQQRDAAEISGPGSVLLVVVLMAPGGGDDVETLTTLAVVPRTPTDREARCRA